MKRVEANIMSRVKKGKMKEVAAKAALGKLTGTLTYDDFGSVDMVRVPVGNPSQSRAVRRLFMHLLGAGLPWRGQNLLSASPVKHRIDA